MKPIIISGTCKELYTCERLLKRFGYIPLNCNSLKTADNHACGYIIVNREGEFFFQVKNPYPDYENIVTATDFMKNYGIHGVRTIYTFANLYFVVTLCLLLTGIEASTWTGRLVLVGLFLVNIPLHWKSIRKLN